MPEFSKILIPVPSLIRKSRYPSILKSTRAVSNGLDVAKPEPKNVSRVKLAAPSLLSTIIESVDCWNPIKSTSPSLSRSPER